jgi:hypothetical protein
LQAHGALNLSGELLLDGGPRGEAKGGVCGDESSSLRLQGRNLNVPFLATQLLETVDLLLGGEELVQYPAVEDVVVAQRALKRRLLPAGGIVNLEDRRLVGSDLVLRYALDQGWPP